MTAARLEPARSAAAPCGATDDWQVTLGRLVEGDPVAHARVSGLIMGLIARARIFDLEPVWEEICQDVLSALVKSVQQGAIRDPKAFVGYCATITRHEIARQIGRASRRRQTEEVADEDTLPEPERRADALELRIDLGRALERLPAKFRSALQAIYLEGRSYEEASSALGLPLGTLKRLQTQGLSALREHMGVAA